jgi:hypothetical protein
MALAEITEHRGFSFSVCRPWFHRKGHGQGQIHACTLVCLYTRQFIHMLIAMEIWTTLCITLQSEMTLTTLMHPGNFADTNRDCRPDRQTCCRNAPILEPNTFMRTHDETTSARSGKTRVRATLYTHVGEQREMIVFGLMWGAPYAFRVTYLNSSCNMQKYYKSSRAHTQRPKHGHRTVTFDT